MMCQNSKPKHHPKVLTWTDNRWRFCHKLILIPKATADGLLSWDKPSPVWTSWWTALRRSQRWCHFGSCGSGCSWQKNLRRITTQIHSVKKDPARISHSGRSLVLKVFPGRHQRVQTVLESDNLKCHVTGGKDENADTARGHTHTAVVRVNNPAPARFLNHSNNMN